MLNQLLLCSARKSQVRYALISLALISLSACNRNDERVQIANTTVQKEGLRGIETTETAPDGTVLDRRFPLSDGRATIIHRRDGTLERSFDEYESTQPQRERSFAEWTADGKTVFNGRLSKPGGVKVLQSTLLDSGEHQNTYTINPDLRAECRLDADGTGHWVWWHDSAAKSSKWFEEVCSGAEESSVRKKLEFFRPASDPTAQPVRDCAVGQYETSDSKDQKATVTFFANDGVTPAFVQTWSRTWEEHSGEEYYESGDSGEASFSQWQLNSVDEFNEDGSQVLRRITVYTFAGNADAENVIVQTAVDNPNSAHPVKREYRALITGKPFEAEVETWLENGTAHKRVLSCGSRSDGEFILDPNQPAQNPEPNLHPAHFVRFKGTVRDTAMEQLRQALQGITTGDDVPELKWQVLDFPQF